MDRFPNAVLVDSNLDEVTHMELESWKGYFEGMLDSSGIIAVEVSNKEEYEDENFSLDEWFKIAKVFLGKKESNGEEEDESSFLGNKVGQERIELRVSTKDLDPLIFLNVVSTFL